LKFRLVLSDVDSTLIEEEVIDLLAAKCGRAEEVSKITSAAMSGELDFRAALLKRVKCLAGLPITVFQEVSAQIHFAPGALELRTFCAKNQIRFGAVTGGFYQVLSSLPFFQDLDFLRANSLETNDGFLTGNIEGEILDREAKAIYLKEFAATANIALDQCIAIGDGANDLEMVKLAGLGVSFRGKRLLREQADLSIETSLAEVIPYFE
jgi:phosphoserine phosphatase